MIEITEAPISPEAVLNSIDKAAHGALISFVGTVRGVSNTGKNVASLDIAASKEAAQKELEQIAQEIRQRWALQDLAICHRIGNLNVGETILVIAITTSHRKEAFEACQYAIDCLKQSSSIREQEIYEL